MEVKKSAGLERFIFELPSVRLISIFKKRLYNVTLDSFLIIISTLVFLCYYYFCVDCFI